MDLARSQVRWDAAATALLALGLGELVASRRQRSVVDPVGRVVVDKVPLRVVEETVRFLATWDKALVRAGIVASVVAAAERAAATYRPRPDGSVGRSAVVAAAGLGAYFAERLRLAAQIEELEPPGRRPTAASSGWTCASTKGRGSPRSWPAPSDRPPGAGGGIGCSSPQGGMSSRRGASPVTGPCRTRPPRRRFPDGTTGHHTVSVRAR